MKKRKLHCSHVSHMVLCQCEHPRYLHDGLEENEHCTVPRCRCESFAAKPGYRDEQLIHETVPVEGRDYSGRQYGKIMMGKQ